MQWSLGAHFRACLEAKMKSLFLLNIFLILSSTGLAERVRVYFLSEIFTFWFIRKRNIRRKFPISDGENSHWLLLLLRYDWRNQLPHSPGRFCGFGIVFFFCLSFQICGDSSCCLSRSLDNEHINWIPGQTDVFTGPEYVSWQIIMVKTFNLKSTATCWSARTMTLVPVLSPSPHSTMALTGSQLTGLRSKKDLKIDIIVNMINVTGITCCC